MVVVDQYWLRPFKGAEETDIDLVARMAADGREHRAVLLVPDLPRLSGLRAAMADLGIDVHDVPEERPHQIAEAAEAIGRWATEVETILVTGDARLRRAVAETAAAVIVTDLGYGPRPGGTVGAPAGSPTVADATASVTRTEVAAAVDILERSVVAAGGSLALPDAGNVLHRTLDSARIRATRWFGAGTLSAFIATSGAGRLAISGARVHVPGVPLAPPVAPDPALPDPGAGAGPGVVPEVSQVLAASKLMRLEGRDGAAVTEAFAEYLGDHTFEMSEATAWLRDRLVATSRPVSSTLVNDIVKVLLRGGVDVSERPGPTVAHLRQALVRGLVDHAHELGTDVAPETVRLVEVHVGLRH
jgi:hypothetical protein